MQGVRELLQVYFNPRSPRGERRSQAIGKEQARNISIHAPRGGSDTSARRNTIKMSRFQSTLPAGGATLCTDMYQKTEKYFNPRSPRGERQCGAVVRGRARRNFNPRSPRGERLDFYWPALANIGISIHAPRGGSDHHQAVDSRATPIISIHAPRGGSDALVAFERSVTRFISIHAPRGGSDGDDNGIQT